MAGHIRYDASTAGGALVAEAVQKTYEAIEAFERLSDLATQVGNMGGAFDAANFVAANNVVFDVHSLDTQAFHDEIQAINTALQTFFDATMQGRLGNLYQG